MRNLILKIIYFAREHMFFSAFMVAVVGYLLNNSLGEVLMWLGIGFMIVFFFDRFIFKNLPSSRGYYSD